MYFNFMSGQFLKGLRGRKTKTKKILALYGDTDMLVLDLYIQHQI